MKVQFSNRRALRKVDVKSGQTVSRQSVRHYCQAKCTVLNSTANSNDDRHTCTATRTSPGLRCGCRAAGLPSIIFVMYTGPSTPWHPKPIPSEPALSNVHCMSCERSFRSASERLSAGCASSLPPGSTALPAAPAGLPSLCECTRGTASPAVAVAMSRSRRSASSSSWIQYFRRACTPRHLDWILMALRCRTAS